MFGRATIRLGMAHILVLLYIQMHSVMSFQCLQSFAEALDMPFGLWARMGPRNHVLDDGPDPHVKGQFWGKGRLL